MPQDNSASAWFEASVQPHAAALRVYLRSRFPELLDLDDLLQETFRRVLERYGDRKTTPEEARKLLFSTARNLAIDTLRRRNAVRFDALPHPEDADFADCALHAGEVLSRQQELELLSAAIQSLPERCRQVLTLRKIYCLSQREIAAQLGITEHTVEAHVQAGLKRCSEFFARLDARDHRP